MSLNINYSVLPTIELIERISVHEDNNALNNFLSTRKLLIIDGKRVLLPEFLLKLKERKFFPYQKISNQENKLKEKLDLTYDRTLQKFSILKNQSAKIEGPYCNNQYNELYKQLNNYLIINETISQLELELKVEHLFKAMVIRHINYSWLEICRITNRLYKRYRWELETGTIELKKPLGIGGRDFTRWLEKHIDSPNPTVGNEKYKIQKEIDDWFGHSSFIDFESIANTKQSENEFLEHERYPEDFPSLIAIEKSKNIDKLRPSIKALGEIKVKEFVKKVLESILYNENNDVSIAKEFGISKATYSRFAGRDWKSNNNGEVPDLWGNIAKIVTSNPILIEKSISMGIKPVIDTILKSR